jgi:hypothetical protein
MDIEIEPIELWNLRDGACCVVGSQDIFNVVGRIARPHNARELRYALNDRPEHAVAFRPADGMSPRLERPGDFNIDTIRVADLAGENQLRLALDDRFGQTVQRRVRFSVRRWQGAPLGFRLDLRDGAVPEELGQVVDGRWRIARDGDGRVYLGVADADGGYDRIITFGDRSWGSGYEVFARVCVTRWTAGDSQGVGLAYRWNDHRQGDGRHLPVDWSTGAAMAFSDSPGLTMMVGVRACKGEDGRWLGETIEGHSSLSPLRQKASRIVRRLRPMHYAFPQIPAGREYCFRLRVEPRRRTLAVWPAAAAERAPQIVVNQPDERLPTGAVGVIAHHCGLRVYDFRVSETAANGALSPNPHDAA